MNAWAREHDAYALFGAHLRECPVCSRERPMLPLCPVGDALRLAAARAESVAQRAEQEADEKADLLDCANEGEARPWEHEGDWRPGMRE